MQQLLGEIFYETKTFYILDMHTTPRPILSMICYGFQVVMGYAHSLVIARQDSQQEQEKLKKLPEYNPRTL